MVLFFVVYVYFFVLMQIYGFRDGIFGMILIFENDNEGGVKVESCFEWLGVGICRNFEWIFLFVKAI